jgi:hypothetical protein
MGQRLIITEEEKKNIRLMYESTPPDESVLVENKNPFLYKEYESARRPYGPNLKDGDLFSVLMDEDLQSYYNTLFKTMYDSYLGKTIRLESTDEIVSIEKSKMWINPARTETSLNWTKPSIDMKVSFYYLIDNVEYIVDFYSEEWVGKVSEDKPGISNNEIREENIEKTLLQILESIKAYVSKYSLNKVDTINNRFFEIRKIQRRKTDF